MTNKILNRALHRGNYYIWGAGYYGLLTALKFEHETLKIKGFIDKNANQIKTKFGWPIYEPDKILSAKKRNFKIIIAVKDKKAIEEIIETLLQAGLKENENFEISPLVNEVVIRRPWEKTIDLAKRILEIGPLNRPIFKKENANVFYADIRDTQEVKNFYRNDKNVNIETIVNIDYVIRGTYSESIRNDEKFDYIVMSHVIEHIPELLRFFGDIKNVLNPGGKLCLTIPDHRFCFDHFRQPTSFAEAYDIYINGTKNLPFRVLDNRLSHTINDCVYWWNNFTSFESLPKSKEQFENAKKHYFRVLQGEYVDAHFSVFTPETFLLLLYNMLNFNLLPFRCSKFYNTTVNTFEFNCILELEPLLLVENSAEQEIEKENLIELLTNIKRDMLEKDLCAYIRNC